MSSVFSVNPLVLGILIRDGLGLEFGHISIRELEEGSGKLIFNLSNSS